jgi:hypothetical protein
MDDVHVLVLRLRGQRRSRRDAAESERKKSQPENEPA